jgi:DNA polymerase III delta prime subunit
MENIVALNLNLELTAKLTHFKEYAVSHPQLLQVDKVLMQAIQEPAGFAHVLIYGPSGVGKTTMIRQISRRLNEILPTTSTDRSSYRHGGSEPVPLLLLETRPPDGGAFNRADYYRTALKLLGEPFYERRLLVDIDTEQTIEKKGRGRSKATQFNDSPELRHALEAAMAKRGVRAVILDEAQHLMKIGSGASGGKLLDQLDWIKSMTNVTGVLHILIGTYELLNFRNLSGQASRRGLDLHFPRYLFQHEQDRQDFQGVLLALLKQVPLTTDIPALMQHWFYFYERSIGCIGVLKDWLIRAVAAAIRDGSDTLTQGRLEEHALSLSQCERMALDAIEGEQKLGYSESRRDHLWRLLQSGMTSTTVPTPVVSTTVVVEDVSPPAKKPRKSGCNRAEVSSACVAPSKRSAPSTPSTTESVTASVETVVEPVPPKKRRSKKAVATPEPVPETLNVTSSDLAVDLLGAEMPLPVSEPVQKKTSRRVGQRNPQRDPVG